MGVEARAQQPDAFAAGVIDQASNPNTMVGRIFPDTIYRFRRSERMLHWSLALPYLVCMSSAAVLFLVYNQHPLLPHRAIFSWTHRIAGALVIALPPLAILLNIRDLRVHLANIRDAWSWSFADLKWLALFPLTFVSKKVRLPEEGKFNPGEKPNFMQSMLSYGVLGATGILIWRDPLALGAWLAHLATAAAVLPIVAGHIFMATINPSTRVGLSGMWTGWVDRHWASHHYRRWYAQMLARHLHYHGKVPELDTTEYDEETGPVERKRNRAARIRWIAGGTVITLLVSGGIGAAAWIFRRSLPGPEVALSRPVGADAPHVNPTLYVIAERPLLSRPSEDAPPVGGDPLKPGAKVTRMAEVGEYALIQDHQARAGYLLKSALSAEAPRVSPGLEFADCAAASGETGSAACEARAQTKLDACKQGCPESRKAVCSQICDDRFATCVEGCRKAVAPAVPGVVAILPDAGPAEPDAGTAEAEVTTDDPVAVTESPKSRLKPKAKPKKPVRKR